MSNGSAAPTATKINTRPHRKCAQSVCVRHTLYIISCVCDKLYGTRLISIENRSHTESNGGGGSLVGSSCAGRIFAETAAARVRIYTWDQLL